ncbi:ATP-dependent RNA helicase HrpA [Salinisphaera sp. Q1T1-3]|uniref:ATP-dependent RNA helicase HrpA n=1 Tax=Salinisphaera sp. Q1T1-3 TaxID=2321229 RepID=UPI000E757C28|nr:ATP-dependent RNA helicase HrpA [Salinisphaera sp. Q1T1-3]RJS95232.1 ATP-dependent RNA helicase HrpA [Salinisphaera sp. Q1T1-3]
MTARETDTQILLAEARTRDRHRLAMRLERAEGKARDAVIRELETSAATTAARRDARPPITLAEGLPVTERADEIREALIDHQVVIVCGETGSGKTTQLPKICMQAGLGAAGRIGHTQPRRLAARSVGQRIAAETGTEFGALVGFATRFESQVADTTQVKLMTDGILLAETARDRYLNQYDTIIIDEAHERTLNIDFLLGYLKRILAKRRDLKIIVTSATIDPERFAAFFDNAPIINVEGRGYPVTVRYRPPANDDTPSAVERAIRELWREGPGDVLVFLPGERDIRDAEQHLSKALTGGKTPAEVVPLYARLTRAAQNRIFSTSNGYRVVLATNVAETSLTVPGIRYVVDTGLARISRYSTAAKVQRLPIEPVSQASCNQRAGRCGRVAPGICIRLFDEDDFANRPAFTDPEIRRTNLANVLLTMADLKLGDIEAFPFIDPPERRYINDGRNLLTQLEALMDGRITKLGRQLARLPLDPRVGRMLIAGQAAGVPVALRVIAAGLTIQDPRERPAEARQAADEAHKPFVDTRSDFMGLLRLWDAFGQARRELSGNKLRSWCKSRYLNFMRMREWEDLVRQLRRIGHDIGLESTPSKAPLADTDIVAVHKALLPGLLDQIGQLEVAPDNARGGAKSRRKQKFAEYQGARGRRFRIFPGSALSRRNPQWLVAGELIETSTLFAHTVAGVDPQWIEEAAAHLVTREHYDPHWEKRRGQVAARERVKLLGLTLSDARKVDFSRIDPATAREIFIRDGLVAFAVADRRGRLPTFLAWNQAVVEEIEAREARFRRRDLLVDDATQAAFYDARLPDHVTDRKTLDKWLRNNDGAVLQFDEDQLLRSAGVDLAENAYPESMTLGDLPVALDYAFEPGTASDGVTARIPLAALNQMSAERAEWLVPGLLEEKFREYLKALPKTWRKSVVPVPDFARAAAERAEFGAGDPRIALRKAIRDMTGLDIPADAWADFTPSAHLRMRFEIIDDEGNPIAAGRDIEALRGELGERARTAVAESATHDMRQQGLTAWPDADLSEAVTLTHAGVSLVAWPALVDRGETVDLELLDDADSARIAQLGGQVRLIRLAAAKPCRLVKRDLGGLKKHAVGDLVDPPITAGIAADIVQGQRADAEGPLVAELLNALIRARLNEAVWTAAAFSAEVEHVRGQLMPDAVALWDVLGPALDRLAGLRKRLSKNIGLDWMAAIEDINDQLAHLVHVGFLVTRASPLAAARDLDRYLKAIEARVDKLARDGAGDDKARMREIASYWAAYKQRAEKTMRREGRLTGSLVELRWMIEEYRVQIFAQPLGTAMKVSAKRLDAQLAAC